MGLFPVCFSKAFDLKEPYNQLIEENYKKLIKALCMEHGIPLITVDDGQKLGEWSGLCKIDEEGEARKIVRCSCVVVRDWGKPSQAQEYVEDHIKKQRV